VSETTGMTATIQPAEALREDDRRQIRRARGHFAAMAGTYCLGVFNDNFYKQAVCLLAVYFAWPEFQGYATIVFTLPWLLLPAHAGWMADRFSKRHVVIAAKVLELAAMLCGATGILLVNWTLILLMLFLMAAQSTIFSPALNGSIPELFPASYVLKANARLKSVVLGSNLVGIILAGVLLSAKTPVAGIELGRWLVALGVVSMSLLGVVLSFGVAYRPAADSAARFPWSGPLETLRELGRMRRDRLLWTVLLTDMFVWFVALLQVLIVNEMGKTSFGLDERQTSYLITTELLGVCIGALLVGRLARGRRWYRVLTPAMVMLGVFTALITLTNLLPSNWRLAWTAGGMLLAGVAGGVLLIPLEAFFQIRPAPQRRGVVIAAANFAGFLAMSGSGLVYLLLGKVLQIPVLRFGIVAALSFLMAVWLRGVLRHEEAS
jgi:acyl-[acyl-carrier-protein]-phospholipid O-acyltransferase/long-chain-fatty-acid--[acyl-carrier-protein] ligase